MSTEAIEAAVLARYTPELRAELVPLVKPGRLEEVLTLIERETRAGAWLGARAAMAEQGGSMLHGRECDDYGPGLVGGQP